MTGTCHLSKCFHPNETHEEGACQQITQPDLGEDQTSKKYCGCIQDGVIRRYEKLGFMEAGVEDIIITKRCGDCRQSVALRIDETICIFCKDKPRNQ